MNEAELIDAVQATLGEGATKESAYQAMEAVMSALRKKAGGDRRVEIAGLGTFEFSKDLRKKANPVVIRKTSARIEKNGSMSKGETELPPKLKSAAARPAASEGTRQPQEHGKLPIFTFNNPQLSKKDSQHLWTLNNPSSGSVEEALGRVGLGKESLPLTKKSGAKTRH